MSRSDVTAVCAALGIGITWDAEGAKINGDNDGATIRSGSGIAGQGGYFFIWGRTEKSRMAHNKRELRRILVEHCAGPRPKHAAYARFQRNRWGEAFTWVNRPYSTPLVVKCGICHGEHDERQPCAYGA